MPSPETPPNTTIARHLDAGKLESRHAPDEEVAAFWKKAAVALADAENLQVSPEARLLRAYDAGRLAALCLVRAAGYRTRGGEGHHYATFDVARSLSTDGELRTALAEMDRLRAYRHEVEYEARAELEPEVVAKALSSARRVIERAAEHLRRVRPHSIAGDAR